MSFIGVNDHVLITVLKSHRHIPTMTLLSRLDGPSTQGFAYRKFGGGGGTGLPPTTNIWWGVSEGKVFQKNLPHLQI